MKKDLQKKARYAFLNSFSNQFIDPKKVTIQTKKILGQKPSQILPILKLYKKLIDKQIKNQKVIITTAFSLDNKTRSYLVKKLKQSFNRSTTFEFGNDKNILGGAKIQVGDQIFDASLETKLKLLEEFDD